MICAKNYETEYTFVEVMQKKLLPLFFLDTLYVCLSVCLPVCLSVCFWARLTDDADLTNEEDPDDDCAASTWLEELGIDQSRYRSLDPAKLREYPL